MRYFGNFNITRKYVVSFMDFFTGIQIQKYRTDPVSGIVPHKLVTVPIMYATTEKWLQVLRNSVARKGFDPEMLDNRPIEIERMLPRIGVNIVGFTYDAQRKLGKMNEISEYTITGSGSKSAIFSPVPYNLELELSIISRNIDENLQILEQIIPYFTPSLSLDIKLFNDSVSESVPIVITSISPDIMDEIMETDERVFIFTLSFTMKCNYYLQRHLNKIINRVDTNYFVDVTDPTLAKFQKYLQEAVNPSASGTYDQRADLQFNPVIKTILDL